MLDPTNMTWKCHICGQERPDAQISVLKRDTSAYMDMPPGTIVQNIRYCNDNPKCIEGAKTFSFMKKPEK